MNHIYLAGDNKVIIRVVEKVQDNFELGTVPTGPGSFQFFGHIIYQDDDYTIFVDGDDKLLPIDAFSISRTRRNTRMQN